MAESCAWVSGSPKRQLYSRSIGPSFGQELQITDRTKPKIRKPEQTSSDQIFPAVLLPTLQEQSRAPTLNISKLSRSRMAHMTRQWHPVVLCLGEHEATIQHSNVLSPFSCQSLHCSLQHLELTSTGQSRDHDKHYDRVWQSMTKHKLYLSNVL